MPQSQRFDSPSDEPVSTHPAAGPAALNGQPDRPPSAPVEVGITPVTKDQRVATLFLMVGLPGAGKTTRAEELATTHQTFAMREADLDQWRRQFQVPDAGELEGGEIPDPPAGWPGWLEWAAHRWPSCTDG